MARYKNGSIYVIILSILCGIAGIILYYAGNDRIVIYGSKTDGKATIGKSDYKLYIYCVTDEYLENVTDVKFRTETAEDKSLVTSVKIFSGDNDLVLIGNDSKIDDRQKREIYNDLDFFIWNKKTEYTKTISFTEAKGIIGFFLTIISVLTFFSMVINMINRKLVEKDKTSFTSSSRLLYGLVVSKHESMSHLKILESLKEIETVAVTVAREVVKYFRKNSKKETEVIEYSGDRDVTGSILAAIKWASNINGDLVLISDTSTNITADNIKSLLREHSMSGNLCTMMTMNFDPEMLSFFQVNRNTINKVSGITKLEKTECLENKNSEFLTGIFCFELRFLFNTVSKLTSEGSYSGNMDELLRFIIKQSSKTGTFNLSNLKTFNKRKI